MTRKHIGNLDDSDIGDALMAFARNVTGDDVSVTFADGVAVLSGRVRSATARQAIEDLVAAHDGVSSVENNMVVTAPAPASPRESGRPA